MPDENELKINITQVVAGQEQVKAATDGIREYGDTVKKSEDEMQASGGAFVPEDMANESAKAIQKETEATEKLDLKKRELLESLRGITRQYPMIGEVARAAFNPAVASIAGVIESVNIWMERMQTAQELLGGFELPDLTMHSVGITAAAEAWVKLKKSVADANTEFNSAAGLYERQAKAVEAQLAATKLLIEAQKKKAESDLDLGKATGQITPEEYIQHKAALEKWGVEQTDKAETDARNNQLAAKKKEVEDLGRQAAAEQGKARAIQPGLNDAALDEQIKKAQDAAAEAKKKADEYRAEAQHAHEVDERTQGGQGWVGLADVAHNIVPDVAFFAKYGLNANPADVEKMNKDAAKQAEETQAALENSARLLQKQKDDRDKHNAEADRLAGLQTTKADEYKNDSDPNVVGSTAWQNAQAAARAKITGSADDTETNAKYVTQFKEDQNTIESLGHSKHPTNKLLEEVLKAYQDIIGILRDHYAVVAQVPNTVGDVETLKQKYAELKGQLHGYTSGSYGSQ